MSPVTVFQGFSGSLANWMFQRHPKWVMNWQNRNFLATPLQQAGFVWVLSLCCGALLMALWWVLVTQAVLPLPSVQLMARQQHFKETLRQSAAQQSQAMNLRNGLDKQRLLILQHQAQIDDLRAAWPNAALRLTLLHRLQRMAHQRGLLVQQLKLMPEPSVNGSDASSLKFSVLGTEDAVQAYWQDLDQWLQNGLWTSWVFRRQADGRDVLEGQLSLRWDTSDADTDTGVELQAEALALANLQTSSAPKRDHVLPKESQVHMKVVGTAQSGLPDGHGEAWTWVRSGAQIYLVRPGQHVGLEQSQAKMTDSQGLWLSPGLGQPEARLDWDVVKP